MFLRLWLTNLNLQEAWINDNAKRSDQSATTLPHCYTDRFNELEEKRIKRDNRKKKEEKEKEIEREKNRKNKKKIKIKKRKQIKTSKCMDPLTDNFTLPIMCKCM